MKKFLQKASIVIAVFALFSVVFSLLQNTAVYNSTLGKVSSNFERTGKRTRYTIQQVNKPYVECTDSNAFRWDATFYRAIRDKMYSGVNSGYADRYAFYPFFPMVWNVSLIRSRNIILLNYLFFGLGIIILSRLLMRDKPYDMFFFIMGLLLPSAIIFYLPYAESLFVLTMSVALFGLIKRKYWLYFLGMVCFSMTRPAVVILIFAFLSTDIIYLFKHRNLKHFIKQNGLMLAPVLAGWAIVTVIQYFYSDSWTAYFDTWDLWPNESGFFNRIIDWSSQGFGMTVAAIFFLALPALVYSIVWFIKTVIKKREKDVALPSLFSGDEEYIKSYFFNVSLLFMVGVVFYFIVTRGGALNGFYRYTMSVPFFYIILFMLPEKLQKISLSYKLGGISLALICMAAFMVFVPYGGVLWRFDYVGLYLFILAVPVLIFEGYLSSKAKVVWLGLFIIPAIIWHTYLFNMYLSDAWIFT